jgi:recombination protein RecA
MYGVGISKEGDLIDLGTERGIIEKSGAWFSYKGERMGQGRENVKQFLKENDDIRQKIEDELRKSLNILLPGTAEVAASASAGTTDAAAKMRPSKG